jgi:hypothetical protein
MALQGPYKEFGWISLQDRMNIMLLEANRSSQLLIHCQNSPISIVTDYRLNDSWQG